MASEPNGFEVIREHGSGSVRVVELKSAKGRYPKYRDEKAYFWNGTHRRTQLLELRDLEELVCVLIQSGLVGRTVVQTLLDRLDSGEDEGTDEGSDLPPF